MHKKPLSFSLNDFFRQCRRKHIHIQQEMLQASFKINLALVKAAICDNGNGHYFWLDPSATFPRAPALIPRLTKQSRHSSDGQGH